MIAAVLIELGLNLLVSVFPQTHNLAQSSLPLCLLLLVNRQVALLDFFCELQLFLFVGPLLFLVLRCLLVEFAPYFVNVFFLLPLPLFDLLESLAHRILLQRRPLVEFAIKLAVHRVLVGPFI